MEDDHINKHSDVYSDRRSNQNELLGMQEPTLGDCWKPVVNESYSGIWRQAMDANNFELKLSLLSMVQQ